MAAELERVQAEVAALRAELGTSEAPTASEPPADGALAADTLMRQSSADEELRLAIMMSLEQQPEPEQQPEDAGAGLVRQSSAVSASGGPASFDAAATAGAKKKAKKAKAGGGVGLSYKEMMAATMNPHQLSTAQKAEEHRARLKAKIDSKDTRVYTDKFERI